MPHLPAAGAGRAETDSRSGVKADPIIIFSFLGSPALCLHARSRFGEGRGGELHSSCVDLFNTYLLIFVKIFLHSLYLGKKEDTKRVHANALGEDKFPRRDALSFGQ